MDFFNIELEWLEDGRVLLSGMFLKDQGARAITTALDASALEELSVSDLRTVLEFAAQAPCAELN